MSHHIQDGGVDAADLSSAVNAVLANQAVEVTTVGGAASEALGVSGVTTGSKIIATLKDNGTNNITILTAKATSANVVTVVFSGDPGNDAIVAIAAF
tara:strand:- start:567 stop:857 length:291 start_codon:yes stop_codon:yes gene_type:complete